MPNLGENSHQGQIATILFCFLFRLLNTVQMTILLKDAVNYILLCSLFRFSISSAKIVAGYFVITNFLLGELTSFEQCRKKVLTSLDLWMARFKRIIRQSMESTRKVCSLQLAGNDLNLNYPSQEVSTFNKYSVPLSSLRYTLQDFLFLFTFPCVTPSQVEPCKAYPLRSGDRRCLLLEFISSLQTCNLSAPLTLSSGLVANKNCHGPWISIHLGLNPSSNRIYFHGWCRQCLTSMSLS
jgi:hypothetical protein